MVDADQGLLVGSVGPEPDRGAPHAVGDGGGGGEQNEVAAGHLGGVGFLGVPVWHHKVAGQGRRAKDGPEVDQAVFHAVMVGDGGGRQHLLALLVLAVGEGDRPHGVGAETPHDLSKDDGGIHATGQQHQFPHGG